MSIGNLNGVDKRDTQVFVVALDYTTVDEVSEFAEGCGPREVRYCWVTPTFAHSLKLTLFRATIFLTATLPL